MTVELTKTERFVLKWLSRADSSLYGECAGSALDHLRELGFASWNETHGVPKEYASVILTAAGQDAANKIPDDEYAGVHR